jgi:hypothetical protein
MAGSHAVHAHHGFSDPVLSARLEALQLLADQVSERIMVVDQDFTILYANRSAWPGGDRQGTDRIDREGRPAGGQKARAARALKISRASLFNELREYGIHGVDPFPDGGTIQPNKETTLNIQIEAPKGRLYANESMTSTGSV